MSYAHELAARFDAIVETGRSTLLTTVREVCDRAVAEHHASMAEIAVMKARIEEQIRIANTLIKETPC